MSIFVYRYGSICEPDVLEGFQQLGFSIIKEETEMYDKQVLPAQIAEKVSKIFMKKKIIFCFSINFFPWLSDLCNLFRIPYLSLVVDSPLLELYSDSVENEYNRIFLFDRELYNEFVSYNPNRIFHIPLATNAEGNQAIWQNAKISQKEQYKADISFVGSLYSEKCPFNQVFLPDKEKGYIDALLEIQQKVYGYYFLEEVLSDEFVETFKKHAPNFFQFPPKSRKNEKAVVAQHYLAAKVTEQERVKTLALLSGKFNIDVYTGSDTSMLSGVNNKGVAKTREEMPIIFHESKINLNMTSKSIRSGLPLRIFDVLGCKGFLITNYQPELLEWFEPGVDLEMYASVEELCDKVTYYLSHDAERKRIAENGYQKVKQVHTYKNRLLQILDLAFPKEN